MHPTQRRICVKVVGLQLNRSPVVDLSRPLQKETEKILDTDKREYVPGEAAARDYPEYYIWAEKTLLLYVK